MFYFSQRDIIILNSSLFITLIGEEMSMLVNLELEETIGYLHTKESNQLVNHETFHFDSVLCFTTYL